MILGTCMSTQRILIDTARATVSGFRALADSLELALDRLDSEAIEPPFVPSSDPAVSHWAFVSGVGSLPLPQVLPPSLTLINYSTASYHHVAAGLTRAPDFCFALCSQLGSPAEVQRRAQRAWEAGPRGGGLGLLTLSGFLLPPSTSASSRPSRIPTPSPIHSPALLKPESIVQPLALLFLTSNEEPQGFESPNGAGVGFPLRLAMAPKSSTRAGGLCDSGSQKERRSFVGSPFGCDPQDGAGPHLERIWWWGPRSCCLFQGPRRMSTVSTFPQAPIRLATYPRVRSCPRRARDPVYLGRSTSCGTCIEHTCIYIYI